MKPRPEDAKELATLRKFYRTVARLTVDHEVIGGRACVTSKKLGDALALVNPEWVKDVEPK